MVLVSCGDSQARGVGESRLRDAVGRCLLQRQRERLHERCRWSCPRCCRTELWPSLSSGRPCPSSRPAPCQGVNVMLIATTPVYLQARMLNFVCYTVPASSRCRRPSGTYCRPWSFLQPVEQHDVQGLMVRAKVGTPVAILHCLKGVRDGEQILRARLGYGIPLERVAPSRSAPPESPRASRSAAASAAVISDEIESGFAPSYSASLSLAR